MPKVNITAFAPDSPVEARKYPNVPYGSSDIDEGWLSGKDFGKEPSVLEQSFAAKWVQLYPELDLYAECQLVPGRKYRYDFAHYAAKVAIEVQGGTYQANTGHTSAAGIQRDYRKLQTLQALDWVVFPLTAADTQDEHVLETIAQTIQKRLKP
ncbi:MAG: hypothetical protein H7Z11_20290 [Verrucomicrobia bacterium]|nr:hypothetical protein [Leptolyngbya sp. ES-bin-22]